MESMKKRLLSLTLALVLCFGLFVPAFAADSDFTILTGREANKVYSNIKYGDITSKKQSRKKM